MGIEGGYLWPAVRDVAPLRHWPRAGPALHDADEALFWARRGAMGAPHEGQELLARQANPGLCEERELGGDGVFEAAEGVLRLRHLRAEPALEKTRKPVHRLTQRGVRGHGSYLRGGAVLGGRGDPDLAGYHHSLLFHRSRGPGRDDVCTLVGVDAVC